MLLVFFQDTGITTRTIGIDFLYFDLIFILIWVGLLIRKKYWLPIGFGLAGWVVYLFVDYVGWYLIMHTRTYTGPIPAGLFFLWFCFSPGFVQFSYVIIMFEKRNWREIVGWTVFFYVGWTLVGVLSQTLPLNDTVIEVARNMNEAKQRLVMACMVAGNLVLALGLYAKKQLRGEDVGYLFAVGTLVEFALEISLAISGIRQAQGHWTPATMIINGLIEFNLGIILMYLIFQLFLKRRDGGLWRPLGWRDRRMIRTDFNLVVSIVQTGGTVNPKRVRYMAHIFPSGAILADLQYYGQKYVPELLTPELIHHTEYLLENKVEKKSKLQL